MHFPFVKTKTKYFLSYLSVFLLTLFLFIFVFQMNINILQKNLYEQNEGNLQQSQQLIEDRLNEVTSMLNLIATDTSIQLLMTSTNPIQGIDVQNTLDFVSARKQLASYMITNSFIDQILLYNPEEDYCISPYSIHLTMESASWEYNFEIMKLNIRDLQEQMQQELTFMTIQDSYNPQEQYLMISKEISNYQHQAYAIIFINTKKILPFFQYANHTGNFYLYNENGELLISSVADNIPDWKTIAQNPDSQNSWHQDDYVSAQVVSPTNQFTYVSILPTEQIFQDVYALENTTFLILIAAFAVVACFSLALSKMNYKPLANLVQTISQYQHSPTVKIQNEWAFISEHIQSSASMSREQEHIRTYLQTSLYSQLLYGHFQTPNDLKNFIEAFPVTITEHSGYRVLIGRFGFYEFHKMEKPLEAIWNLKQMVKKWLAENLQNSLIILEPSYNHIVMLFDAQELNVQELEAQLKQLSQQVSNTPQAFSRFAISESISSLTDLSKGYEHAMSALGHREMEEHSPLITFDSEKVMDMETAYFPPVLQIKLTHAVTCCNEQELSEIFQDIFEKNFDHRSLSDTALHFLYFNLCACLLDVSAKLSSIPQKLTESMQQCFHIREVSPYHFQKIRECFTDIVPLFEEQSRSITASIPQQILQYIQENLHSPEFCLTMVAEEFALSEPYISTLVKEQTGVSFIQFVTEKRMEYAFQLLKSNQYSISEIAEKTGYHSVNSFRKAFKKITGQTPSDYLAQRRSPNSTSV